MFFQPGTACLCDPILQIGKVGAAVGIRVDADEHTFILGVPALQVQQVHALGLCIELKAATALASSLDDCGQIQVQRVALVDESA